MDLAREYLRYPTTDLVRASSSRRRPRLQAPVDLSHLPILAPARGCSSTAKLCKSSFAGIGRGGVDHEPDGVPLRSFAGSRSAEAMSLSQRDVTLLGDSP